MTFKTFAAACVSVCTATAGLAATVVIDDFDNTAFQVVGAPTLGVNFVNPASTSGPTSDAIGGIRTITNERTVPVGGIGSIGQQVQSTVTGGFANVSLGMGIQGTSLFQWNAGGADLVDGTNDAVFISVLQANQGVTFNLSINGFSTSQTVNGAEELEFSFASFAGIDFTDVDDISLFISGPAAFETEFDFIRADVSSIDPSPVPLPAGGLLLLTALCGVATLKRQKKLAA